MIPFGNHQENSREVKVPAIFLLFPLRHVNKSGGTVKIPAINLLPAVANAKKTGGKAKVPVAGQSIPIRNQMISVVQAFISYCDKVSDGRNLNIPEAPVMTSGRNLQETGASAMIPGASAFIPIRNLLFPETGLIPGSSDGLIVRVV